MVLDAAPAKYYIRRMAVETLDVLTEIVYHLPFGERNDLAAIRRMALADVSNYGARLVKALPDIGANAQRTPRVRPPRARLSTGSTLHVTGHEAPNNLARNVGLLDTPLGARFDLVLIMPAKAIAKLTSSDTFNTARSLEDPTNAKEVDLTKRIQRFIPSHVPALTTEQVRLAEYIMPPNSPYHRFWLYQIVEHTLYTCPFPTKEQQIYSTFRSYDY